MWARALNARSKIKQSTQKRRDKIQRSLIVSRNYWTQSWTFCAPCAIWAKHQINSPNGYTDEYKYCLKEISGNIRGQSQQFRAKSRELPKTDLKNIRIIISEPGAMKSTKMSYRNIKEQMVLDFRTRAVRSNRVHRSAGTKKQRSLILSRNYWTQSWTFFALRANWTKTSSISP